MTSRHRRIQEWAGKRSKRYDVPCSYSEHQMLKRIRQLKNEGCTLVSVDVSSPVASVQPVEYEIACRIEFDSLVQEIKKLK